MARIYKRTDRIPVKIDEITLRLAPLSLDQKNEIRQLMLEGGRSASLPQLTKGMALALKYSIKSISGVVDGDGKDYALQFDGEHLKDECVDDLLNLEITKKLTMVCSSLANGVPSVFTDEKGVPLEGVEILDNQKDASAKNA